MAAAVSIARWLLNEASSGTGPTTVADDEGTHDLTIDYGTGDANWNSNDDGNGLDFIDINGTAVAELADMSGTGSIGDLMLNLKECSIIIACDIDVADGDEQRLFAIGTNAGNGDLAVTVSDTKIRGRFHSEAVTSRQGYDHTGGTGNEVYGEHIFHFVFNSAEATAADRLKFYIDNSVQSRNASLGDIVQDSALSFKDADTSVTIGNRPDGLRELDSKVWYVELFTGLLTTDEISDSYDALLLDHDANWQGGTSLPTGLSTETDTSLALAAEKRVATGTALETDTALALALEGGVEIAVGLATETDASLALVAEKRAPVGLVTETDVALSRGWFSRLATEADVALGLATLKRAAVGRSDETGTSLALSGSKHLTVGRSDETGAALAPSAAKHVAVGVALETDAALAVSPHKTVPAGIAAEVDAALALVAEKRGGVGVAAETDVALILLGGIQSVSVGLSLETDAALALAVDLRLVLASPILVTLLADPAIIAVLTEDPRVIALLAADETITATLKGTP